MYALMKCINEVGFIGHLAWIQLRYKNYNQKNLISVLFISIENYG